MKKLVRIAALAVTVSVTGTALGGVGSVASNDLQGHRSSLRAIVTLASGQVRTVTLDGVGCSVAICSRVRVLDANTGTVWLDELASMHDISAEADGVTGVFTFRDGSQRRASIRAGNRILYVARRFGFIEQLDLAGLKRIEFD